MNGQQEEDGPNLSGMDDFDHLPPCSDGTKVHDMKHLRAVPVRKKQGAINILEVTDYFYCGKCLWRGQQVSSVESKQDPPPWDLTTPKVVQAPTRR